MSQINLTFARLQSYILLVVLSSVISIFRCNLVNATVYYVSGNGNDTNNGLATSTAFRTIQRAADLTVPGDTVYVMNGLYTNSSPTGDVVTVHNSGSPSGWITYQAYPGNYPHLQFNGWTGFNVSGASYIVIAGFQIEGNNNQITLDYAMSQRENLNNPLTSGNGISAYANNQNTFTHHIIVINNNIYECGGAGIVFTHSDYITINHNTVYNNSWYSPYGSSGIELYQNWNSDNNTNAKIAITNNISSGNYNKVPFYQYNIITDGNGIIIDDSENTQMESNLGKYTGRTYVVNNLVSYNGGSGIHTYSSEHVDIINNTAYMNLQSPEIQTSVNKGQLGNGEIDALLSDDVNILNNIIVTAPGNKVNNVLASFNVNVDYNIYFGSTNIPVLGPHDLQTNPQFVNAPLDYHLQSISPAINSGTSYGAPTIDYDGNSRPSCGGIDRGAYEFTSCPSVNFPLIR